MGACTDRTYSKTSTREYQACHKSPTRKTPATSLSFHIITIIQLPRPPDNSSSNKLVLYTNNNGSPSIITGNRKKGKGMITSRTIFFVNFVCGAGSLKTKLYNGYITFLSKSCTLYGFSESAKSRFLLLPEGGKQRLLPSNS